MISAIKDFGSVLVLFILIHFSEERILVEWLYVDDLMQKRHNSIANALELSLFYIKPSICKNCIQTSIT